MKLKISAAILAFILVFSLFTACKAESEPETASLYSDSDSAKIKEEFEHLNNQLNVAEAVTNAGNPEDFKAGLADTESDSAGYEGTENITISLNSKLDKTVSINTTGAVDISSEISALVLKGAAEGITLNARVDSTVISGSDITADVKSATGSIYIKGKNVTVNVMNNDVEKIVVNNIYTTVNNLTDTEIFVTLTSGSKVRVPTNSTYYTENNTLQKYKPAK